MSAEPAGSGMFEDEGRDMVKSNGLINRLHCKQFALQWAQDNRRGWQPERVSKQFLDDLDTKVRLLIQSAVNRHRSVGKTVKDLL